MDDVCVCGHNIDDHGGNGTCLDDDCGCLGFEPMDESEAPNG